MSSSSGTFGGTVFTPHLAQHRAALADGHVVGERNFERRHEVLSAAGRSLDVGQATGNDGLIAPRPQPFQRARLGGLLSRADLRDLDLVLAGSRVAVDSHDDAVPGFDPRLAPIGALGDTDLRPPRFDAFPRAA